MKRTGEASRDLLPNVGTAAMIGSVLLAACENPQPPGQCGTIAEQTVAVGETATVRACFDDANGDMLSFGVSSSDPGIATVRASGSTVTVTAVAPGTASMTVTATDVTGLSGNQQFRVIVPNRAPIVLGAIDARELPAGESAEVDVSAHFAEPDGQELGFAFSVSDESIVSISADGPVVTIAARAKGSATVTVTATDPGGLSATQSFRATVPNRAPAAHGSMPEQTIEVGARAATDVTEYFSDPDGDALAYTASSSDATVVVVSISGADLTVGPIAKGVATVTVTATDEEGLTATQSFAVTAPNRPPVAAGSMEARTIEVDETADVDLSPYFSDPDGDVLAFTATVSDAAVVGASVDGGALTVGAVAKGEATVTVTATDTEGLTARQEFVVTVPNRGPLATGSIAEQTIEAGEVADLDLSGHFSDPDDDALTFTATVSDAAVIEASIDAAVLSVSAAAKGTATVVVTATDTDGLAATLAFAVTVPNRPPLATGSIDDRTFAVGETVDLHLSDYFTDPDGDALAFTATVSDPQVAGIAVSGSELTATALAKGAATVTVTATDGDGMAAAQAWIIGVSNQPPHAVGTIEGLVIGVDETRTIELSDYFGDSDGDALTYTAATSTTGVADVAVSDGVITVTAVARGTAGITVVAADADGLEATQAFVVTVPNRAPAPVGAIPELRLTKGGIRRVDPTPGFTDPDGDLLAFEAASSRVQVARVWVSNGDVLVRALKKGTAMVTITAKDSEGLDATQHFSVRVKGSGGSNPNRPPEVVGDIHEQKLEEGDKRRVDASSYFSDPDDDALDVLGREFRYRSRQGDDLRLRDRVGGRDHGHRHRDRHRAGRGGARGLDGLRRCRRGGNGNEPRTDHARHHTRPDLRRGRIGHAGRVNIYHRPRRRRPDVLRRELRCRGGDGHGLRIRVLTAGDGSRHRDRYRVRRGSGRSRRGAELQSDGSPVRDPEPTADGGPDPRAEHEGGHHGDNRRFQVFRRSGPGRSDVFRRELRQRRAHGHGNRQHPYADGCGRGHRHRHGNGRGS